jgi:outer membrane protein
MKKAFFSFLLIAILQNIGLSQDEWSLNRCIQYAIENSFDIYQSDLELERSAINTKQSRDSRLPDLSGSANAFVNFGRSIDPTTNSFVTTTFFSNGYSLNTNMTLYNGGRIKNSILQSEEFEKVSEAQKSTALNMLTLNTVSAFFEVLFAQDNYDNVNLQVKAINDQIDQMIKLVDAGSRAKFELFDLEAQQATSEQDLVIAQNRIDIAMVQLKAIINLPSEQELRVKKPDFDQQVYTNLDLLLFEDAYQRALAFQPATRQLDHQINAASIGVEIAESAFYPFIGIGGSAGTNYSNQGREIVGTEDISVNSEVLINNQPAVITTQSSFPVFDNSPYGTQFTDNFNYGFGLNVSVPIYNRGATKANVSRAKIDLENLETEKNKNLVIVRNDLMQLITDAKASKLSLDAAEKTLKAREISYENAEKRYQLGALNSYDYISIQDQVNTARTNYLLAKYDYVLRVKLLDYYQGYPVGLD